MRLRSQSSTYCATICRRDSGFMLVGALFIVLVLSAAVLSMLNLSLSQSVNNSIEVQSQRALLAAQSGLEWGIYRAKNGSCVASTQFTLSEQDLDGFAVAVTCTQALFSEGAATVSLFNIESVAQWGSYQSGGEEAMSDYVYRKVNAVVEI